MSNNPFSGFKQAFIGIRLLFRPGLKRYLMVPLAVNLLVFSLVAWLGFTQFEGALERWLPDTSWLYYFRWILWPLFTLAFLMLVFYTFTVIANLLAAPFNSLLAARTEELLTGSPPPETPGSIAAAIAPALLSEIRKLIYFLLRAIPLLLLFLIPGINVLAPFLWLAFSAWFLSLEYMDYPLGNQGMGFKEQHRRMKQGRLTALGFGGGVMLLMLIPGINLAAMPAAVAGATSLWCRNREGLAGNERE